MSDLITRMSPQPTALVNRDVGAVKIRLPIDGGNGTMYYVDIGINLAGVPVTWLEDSPVAAFKLREAVGRALTGPISTKYGTSKRPPEDVSMKDLLTDLVLQKVRSTL